MLATDSRVIATDLLRPPAGYRLKTAILTTFSLDLEALLALPLAVLSQSDSGVEELLSDPLLLLESLREAGERIHVFVDHAGIAIPRNARPLYAMLEGSVHPVRAPNGGAFHSKVWIARFVSDEGQPLIRTAVLSRNLTYDCSWDVALTTSGNPEEASPGRRNVALRSLLEALPLLAVHSLPQSIHDSISELAADIARTRLPAPDGFGNDLTFHALGLKSGIGKPWRPFSEGGQVLAIAPFANATALNTLAGLSSGKRTLVSRQDTLDSIPESTLAPWHDKLIMSSLAEGEASDSQTQHLGGLHAKLIAVEHGWDVTWFTGSANLTAAAFTGKNVEIMASMTGRKGRLDGKTGNGIDRFLDSGFRKLCQPYVRNDKLDEDPAIIEALRSLEQVRDDLLNSDLEIDCVANKDSWAWTLRGTLNIPADVTIQAWPLSIEAHQARLLTLPSLWQLPTSRLTSFVAFVLSVPGVAIDDIRLTIKLPVHGMPEGRIAQILRTLIDSPERFLLFLQALLGGLEGLADWPVTTSDRVKGAPWTLASNGHSVLEDLLRTASRDPARLEPIRRLIDDLRAADEGDRIVPDSFLALWSAVEKALTKRARA